jgi:hypothetical protein
MRKKKVFTISHLLPQPLVKRLGDAWEGRCGEGLLPVPHVHFAPLQKAAVLGSLWGEAGHGCALVGGGGRPDAAPKTLGKERGAISEKSAVCLAAKN